MLISVSQDWLTLTLCGLHCATRTEIEREGRLPVTREALIDILEAQPLASLLPAGRHAKSASQPVKQAKPDGEGSQRTWRPWA